VKLVRFGFLLLRTNSSFRLFSSCPHQGLAKPPNEVCSGALPIQSFPFSITESNAGAFPNFSNLECGVDTLTRGLWYAVTNAESKDTILQATLSDQTFDASLSLYRGSCDNPSCIAGTQAFEFVDRKITFTARVGQTNYLHVSGESFGEAGAFTLDVVAIDRPVNDVCESATSLASAPSSIFETSEGAVPELGFQSIPCEIPANTRGLWYDYTPTESAVHVAQIANQDFSARLSLFDGPCGNPSCRRSAGPFEFVEVGIIFAGYTDRTNYLHVSGEDFGEAGPFGLSLEVSGMAHCSQIFGNEDQLTICSSFTRQVLPRPPNDTCETATMIDESTGPFTTTNRAALPQFESVACDINRNARVLWYSFTPTDI